MNPATGATAAVGQVDGRDRLDFIDSRLTHVARSARLWTWGWGVGIGASGVASLAVVPFVAAEERVDWYTSAASAAVGVIPFVVSPLRVIRDARELHEAVAASRSRTFLHTIAGAATPARLQDQASDPDLERDVCTLLSDAETRLVRDAEDQRWQQGWWVHAGNVAFNTAVTLFLGLGFHRWESGLINGLAGAAVGEALIFTQPTGTREDLRTYRAASF